MDNQFKRILVIRTDRMGDVVLSTPVLTAIKTAFPHTETTMLVASYAVPVVSGHPDLDHILIDDKDGEHQGFSGLLKLARLLHSKNFDAVLVLHPTSRLALLCLLAQIPLRVGTGYRAYSFLFNRKIYQHRKKSGRHELELNLDLAAAIGAPLQNAELKFHVPDKAYTRVNDWLKTRHLGPKTYVVLHPGTGGSALDWPIEKFGELAVKLEAQNTPVVITGTAKETPLVNQIKKIAPAVVRADGEFSIKELAALLQSAFVVVANSTGPLHLAAAVGAPVTGLFCTLPSCHPNRWGPYSKSATVITPPENADYTNDQNPMRLITVDQVLKSINDKAR